MHVVWSQGLGFRVYRKIFPFPASLFAVPCRAALCREARSLSRECALVDGVTNTEVIFPFSGRDLLQGVPIIRIRIYGGSILGSPISRKPPFQHGLNRKL